MLHLFLYFPHLYRVRCGVWPKSLNESQLFAHCRITQSFTCRATTHKHNNNKHCSMCVSVCMFVLSLICAVAHCSLLIAHHKQFATFVLISLSSRGATRRFAVPQLALFAHATCRTHKHTHTHMHKYKAMLAITSHYC